MREWYRAFSSSAGSSSKAALLAPKDGPAQKEDEEEEDSEVEWVPQDEGDDSDIEFLPPPAPPPPPPPAPSAASTLPPSSSLAVPLPDVPNPRPTPSFFPRPEPIALPPKPLGVNHFTPYAPPPSVSNSKRSLLDMVVLPDGEGESFQPPTYYALGPSNRGHQLLRQQGWTGSALGLPVSPASSLAFSSSSTTTTQEAAGRLAPISTSLLPAQRGLSAAVLKEKRVTHSIEEIDRARQRGKDGSGWVGGKEAAERERRERDERKELAARLNG